ncbi:MAG: phosphate/phosphite/phosphonate ABC transporter substrate-binding protein [Nitrospirae bacterium]|nr:phosphate/phosphite/phosphonate ABC transporter substrate-binding protein [Nitrospirota bacterium]
MANITAFKKSLLFLLVLFFAGTSAALAQDVVKMGVFPRKPTLETVKAFEPMAKYLSSKIGKKVELVVYKDFAAFWDSMKKKECDFVHLNQYQYIKAHKDLGYNVILMNEEFGSAKVHAAIAVRTDSGINSLSDLKGKKILFGGGKQAMQSYIGATHILKKHGLKKDDYTEDFAINPPSVVFAVFNKTADAGGIGEVVLSLSTVKEKIDVNQIKVLARGDELPMLCWAVKKEMDKGLAEKIQKAMIGLKNEKDGQQLLKNAEVTDFIMATDKEYDIVRKIVKEALNEDYH